MSNRLDDTRHETDGRVVVPLLGLPEGVVAVTIPRRGPEGPKVPVDRRRRLRASVVDLVAEQPSPTEFRPPPGLAEADLRWVLATRSRRWAGIESRFKASALSVAIQLVRSGGVVLRCETTADLTLGQPRGWRLTDVWEQCAQRLYASDQAEATGWQQRAQIAADAIQELDAGLASQLRAARGTEPRLPVLVHAAEDLAAGIAHDGPRAFSQTHFGHTKARDDAAAVLEEAGASESTLLALGLRRSPYVGLGGPVVLHIGGSGRIDLALLDGPIRFRADQRHSIAVRTTAEILIVVENLQTAESTCDNFLHVAVVWTAGQPSDAALRSIAELARQVRQIIVVPDADLGGVRIAKRVVSALPQPDQVTVVDIGAHPHPQREPFGQASLEGLRLAADAGGPSGALAASCLARGYPVEQEASSRAAIAALLGSC